MESRAKETAKKTAKKGKNGIVKLIFSRIFIFALLIFLQLLVLFYFFWHVNEQFKIFYDFIRIITVFLVLYIVNEKSSDPTMKMIWSIVILIIPIFGAFLYVAALFGGYIAITLLAGYVLLMESNEWLKKTAVKAVATLACFSFLSLLIGLIPVAVEVVTSVFIVFFNFFGKSIYPSVINTIFSVISQIISFLKDLVFAALIYKALNQGTVKLPVIDKLIDKYI